MVLSLWVAHSIFLNRRLLQSQSRYRQFFNDSPVAHIVIDKHHKIIEWNLTAEITFGWKEDEAKQKNIINFLVPEFNRSQRTGQKAALYFIDLNDFKLINDQFGHDAGDMLLKSIGHNLRACLRNTDTICRYGGDEFVVIIENIKDKDYIEAVFETIHTAICEPIQISKETTIRPRASIGMALYPDNASTPQELLRAANSAMYEVKKEKHRHKTNPISPSPHAE